MPNKTISIIDKDAPDKFARTSKRSACLVSVNTPCAISIPIPKKKENRKDKSNGFLLL